MITEKRTTNETQILIQLNLYGSGTSEVDTGIGFFNHLIQTFSRFSSIDLQMHATGDLEVDQHHLVEDCGISLGQAIDKALKTRENIERCGFSILPMDDSLSRAVIDFGGRPYSIFEAKFKRRFCGDFDLDLMTEFFRGLANGSRANIHLKTEYGNNDHHIAESLFKAFGKALKMAIQITENGLLSTKGVI